MKVMRPLYLLYTLWFVGLSIALPVLLTLIARLTGIDLSSSALSVIPTMTASMVAGMSFAKSAARRPTKPEAWRFATVSLMIFAVGTLVLGGVLAVFDPGIAEALSGLSNPRNLGIFTAIFSVILGVVFLLNRYFFGLGGKNQSKVAPRKSKGRVGG